MDTFHQQLARIAFDAAADLGLILAGEYAIRAHGLTSRPGDLDFVTRSPLPLAEVTERLAAVYRTSGFSTPIIESAPTASRLEVVDGALIAAAVPGHLQNSAQSVHRAFRAGQDQRSNS